MIIKKIIKNNSTQQETSIPEMECDVLATALAHINANVNPCRISGTRTYHAFSLK
jgi:hypothetical protein